MGKRDLEIEGVMIGK